MLLDRMVATKTIRIECNKADDIDENEEGEWKRFAPLKYQQSMMVIIMHHHHHHHQDLHHHDLNHHHHINLHHHHHHHHEHCW